jgi:nucleotide-binding universal stress UspA family protein
MKILIATDGSPYSEAAIREAARLLPLKGAEVHVACVANLMPVVASYEPSAGASAMLIDRELAGAHHDGAHAVELLATLGVTATSHDREGEPSHEIVALATSLAVDLIVIGSHGKNGFERLFFGSTSDAVAHNWGGAVLIVRPKA